jgi:hypothetical protein
MSLREKTKSKTKPISSPREKNKIKAEQLFQAFGRNEYLSKEFQARTSNQGQRCAAACTYLLQVL